jgi:hypothetical protein
MQWNNGVHYMLYWRIMNVFLSLKNRNEESRWFRNDQRSIRFGLCLLRRNDNKWSKKVR